MCQLLRNVFRLTSRLRRSQIEQIKATNSQMDQGDYHSGPLGYSANTAYPETQYGRGFEDFEEESESN